MRDNLRDLLPFVRFKKREKKSMQECSFSEVAGCSLQLYGN